MEQIKIAINTKDTLPLHELNPLQGNLKTLSDENYQKLKKEILVDGFSFAVHVYEDIESATIYILDGHQRCETLRRMKEEGYQIPQIPVVIVDADNLDHAKRKVLAAASQYGEYNQQGAEEFISSIAGVDFSYLNEQIQMPYLDFSNMNLNTESKTVDVQAHEREIKNSNKELNEEDFQDFEHTCPKCGFQWD